ncbi:hypothetical protein [Butyrivibrio proteoclasticus]|uniref:hypothetical protein n=1 Tax=Butyrivibrio proteoclasticus TaxID=43305 RepID=UPI00047B780E|nr:hypothetical protein [Butyrivibrio proteoclasticus]
MKTMFKRSLTLILSVVLLSCIPAFAVRAAGYSTGAITDNVYENEFFGFKLTLPDGYEFVSDEQLTQIAGRTLAEIKDNEGTIASIENGEVVTYAFASDSTGLNSINIVLSKNANSSVTVKEAMDAAIEEIVPILEDSGFIDINAGIEQKKALGTTNDVMYVEGKIGGFGFYEKQIAFFKDGYAIHITIANYGEDNTQALFDGLSKIK